MSKAQLWPNRVVAFADGIRLASASPGENPFQDNTQDNTRDMLIEFGLPERLDCWFFRCNHCRQI